MRELSGSAFAVACCTDVRDELTGFALSTLQDFVPFPFLLLLLLFLFVLFCFCFFGEYLSVNS